MTELFFVRSYLSISNIRNIECCIKICCVSLRWQSRCRGKLDRVVEPSRRVHTLVGNNRYKSKLGHVAHSSRSCFATKLIISHKLASRAFPCELSRRARCIRGRAEALHEIQPSTVHLIMRSLTRTTCTRACEGSYVRAFVCLPLLRVPSLSLSLSIFPSRHSLRYVDQEAI